MQTISKKISDTNRKMNKKLSKEQLSKKCGWLNKLQEPEKTVKINEIKRSLFLYYKNETEEQKDNRRMCFNMAYKKTCMRKYGVPHPNKIQKYLKNQHRDFVDMILNCHLEK